MPIIKEAPGYQILGHEFVLSTACISQLCAAAPFITSKEESKDVLALTPQYQDRIYHTMYSILVCALRKTEVTVLFCVHDSD